MKANKITKSFQVYATRRRSALTSHGGDPQSDSDGEFDLSSLENERERGETLIPTRS